MLGSQCSLAAITVHLKSLLIYQTYDSKVTLILVVLQYQHLY